MPDSTRHARPTRPTRLELVGVLLAMLVAMLLIATQGCIAPGQLAAEDIGPAVDVVVERHDVYVAADSALTPAARASYLLTARLLKQAVDEALARAEATP